MNYLAHAYLSFGDEELLLGNMISDHVKGKKKEKYPIKVQQGIALHRSIDHFTDTHAATLEIQKIFYPAYGRYSGAFADIVYDHFLALDSQLFPKNELWRFSQWVYARLDPFQAYLPEKFASMYSYMKKDNWLYHYKEKWAIQRSFKGLVQRAAYLTDSETAYTIFEREYTLIMQCYQAFMPDLMKAAQSTYLTIQGLN